MVAARADTRLEAAQTILPSHASQGVSVLLAVAGTRALRGVILPPKAGSSVWLLAQPRVLPHSRHSHLISAPVLSQDFAQAIVCARAPQTLSVGHQERHLILATVIHHAIAVKKVRPALRAGILLDWTFLPVAS